MPCMVNPTKGSRPWTPPSGVFPGVVGMEPTTRLQLSIPRGVTEYLAKAGFRPGRATRIAEDGWPAVIARSEGEPRTMIRHGRVYLPQGYEPESEGTDEGLPRVVKSQHGVRFIRITGDWFMMGALDNSDVFDPDERPSPSRHPLDFLHAGKRNHDRGIRSILQGDKPQAERP